MSHSIEVHQRHYEELHGAKFAAQAHKTIAKIVQKESPTPQRKKRRSFFVEESEEIKKWFAEFISSG